MPVDKSEPEARGSDLLLALEGVVPSVCVKLERLEAAAPKPSC